MLQKGDTVLTKQEDEKKEDEKDDAVGSPSDPWITHGIFIAPGILHPENCGGGGEEDDS